MSRYALVKSAGRFTISEEVAQEQMMEFLCYYDIDTARITDPARLKLAEQQLDHMRDFIREGKLEVRRGAGEKLEVVQHLSNGQEVVYTELNATAKLAMDKYPVDQNYARMYALMGALGNIGIEGIQKFPTTDLSVVEVIGPLFQSA